MEKRHQNYRYLVDSSGNFSFSGIRSLGIDLVKDSSLTKYVIEFSCGSSTYQRFVTGALEQKLGSGTTLMAWVSQTDASASVRTQNAQSWGEFFQTLEGSSSLTAAFSTLNSNPKLKAKFQSLFGFDPNILNDAVPKIDAKVVPSSFNEEVGQALSVQATHWSSTYNIAYAWKVGSLTLSNASNFTYIPSANAQGTHTVQLFIGQDNGSGGVDTSKPYTQEIFPITIQNSLPATVPSVSRVSAQYTTSLLATIRMATGTGVDGRPQNCKSFSKLALVEENFPAGGVAPLLTSSYDIDCTSTTQQDVNVTLSGTEGIRVLRLWARDAAGNISATSQDVSIVLDRVSPSITLTSLDGGQIVRGGSVASITWTTIELNPAANPISLEYSINGGSTWATMATSLANSGSYNWTVPSVNSSNVKIRIGMLDLAGNYGSTTSTSAFTIDSTTPSTPAIARSSAQFSNSVTVSLLVTCDADFAGVFLSSSATAPLATDSGWQTCASSMNTAVATGDGTKTVYAFAKDMAGNVSTGSSATMTLDQTLPSVSLTSLNSSQIYIGGSSQVITWTATDGGSGFSATPIALLYTIDGGTTWNSLTAFTSNDGTEAWSLPAIDSNNVKVKVTATDQAGNITSEISSSVFTVDSSPPVVASTLINDGAVYAGTALLSVKTNVSDNFSSAAQISVRLGNANSGTGDCQSEYSNDSWTSYTNATTNIGFTITPVDGTKKICIWSKDSVGNVSVFSPTTGTPGVNTDSIDFQIGHPPEFVSFLASRTSDSATNGVTSGQGMTISYSLIDVEGLDNNPISIAYTTNNTIWKDIITNQDISNQANMTWLGGLAGNPTTSASIITTWNAPSSGYFRLKAVAKDMSGNTSIPAMSGVINMSGWSLYAGSTDRGDGGTGKTAVLFCDPYGAMFAINPRNGDVYAADCGFGIKKMDSRTGILTNVVPYGTNNLPADGALPASPRFETGITTNLHFDSKVYVNSHSGPRFKILNGTIYSSNTPTPRRTAWNYYNALDGKLYSSNSTGGISITTPSLVGNGGETVTAWFNGNSATAACNLDGVSIANYCGAADVKIVISNGQILFADGAISNSGSNYSIRFVDSQNKVQTLMGSLPLYGDGKQKALIRGNITGIYYKKATDPNLTAFPEGLYFMEKSGVSFNYINPTSGVMETLWGNQNRITATFVNGDTISKNLSMGFAYWGGEGYALMFDDTGLPWMRSNYQLVKINSNKQIELKTSGSAYWDTLADGANPATARMYVNGTSTNIALKGQTFFAIGGAYVLLTGARDPDVGIKAMDFANSITTKIFGGTAKYSQLLSSAADVGAGLVTSTRMWHACGGGTECYSAYDPNTDRLYFSENTMIRYITTPNNTATATLVTLYSNAARIYNLTVTPDGSQVWFSKGNNIYCKDISSGKSWCDSTTDHFQAMSTAGFSMSRVANQFTWKDNSTLFISSNTGFIFQFNLPTGP